MTPASAIARCARSSGEAARLAALLMALVLPSSGCSLILAPICLAQQKKGHVTTIEGEAAPGTVISHAVAYGTRGSQNDLRITWNGQTTPGGARIAVYLTSVACEQFDPRVTASRQDPCRRIGSMGSSRVAGELVQWSAGITHGRGNPEQLGPEAHYKLWIVADPKQLASYRIDVSWFYGPDC